MLAPRLLLPLVLALLAGPALAQPGFIAFESGAVRPVALSPNGARLFVANIPDNQLEVFDVLDGGVLVHALSVPVGMEPVAVAPRTNDEVWVVNHLSDSVSIVDLAATPPRVVRTLVVGDEPRDIVFAGPGGNRAFITTAHRGQHRTHASISAVPGAGDPQLTTPGVDRADVWVFDALSLGGSIGGTPTEILTFFADTPRALATDGSTVYVAAFHSGNQTTAINDTLVPDGFTSTCGGGGGGVGVPGPSDNTFGDPAPETGLILKFDGSDWVDALGCTWNGDVPFDLPDHDVFAVDASTLAPGSVFDHVGTILFNMAVNPVSGKVYVTNTESPNHVRFEGPGVHGGSTVQGHLSEARITVLDPSGPSVDPQHLNQHIDYGLLHTDPGANHALINGQAAHSLATPLQPVVSSDGAKVYVAAFGSSRIGVFDAADVEDPSFEANFDPTVESASYLTTQGGGPAGLALDETNDRLYVLTRFDNALEVIDVGSGASVAVHPLHNPEPASVVDGRPLLYDAQLTSANGEASCASCHIFADFDSLAWNLGDPDAAVSNNTQPSATPSLPPAATFHPMKGPMTTQTLRGMATHGGMHWRGDRVDGFFGQDACTGSPISNAPCDEDLSFRNFIVAFEGLLGKEGTVSPAQMQQFADFILQVFLPPNPVRDLDNSLTADQQDGLDVYDACPGGTCSLGGPGTSDTVEDCDGCHDLSPIDGFFGSGGEQSFEGEPQNFKVAHQRNLYAKIGMFSTAGPQVRGFGFLHDGSVDTVKTFLGAGVFNLSAAQESDLEQFVLAFPSDLAPIVGQQVTLTSSNGAIAGPRIDTLIARAAAPFDSFLLGGTVTECDLVVKGSVAGAPRGWVREAGGQLRDDQNALWNEPDVRALAATEGPLTYTCAPPGSGTRMGINRDGDALLDGLDNCAGVANDLQENLDGDPQGDACDADDDGDALLDVVETDTGIFVGPHDTGSDPLAADSDGDGFDDGVEVDEGTDPNDPGSFPNASAVPLGGALPLAVSLAVAGVWATRRSRRAA